MIDFMDLARLLMSATINKNSFIAQAFQKHSEVAAIKQDVESLRFRRDLLSLAMTVFLIAECAVAYFFFLDATERNDS
jgi:hypothetical protein